MSHTCTKHANYMTMTTSGQIMSWPDYLKTKGNVNIKLWDLCEILIVHILLSTFQSVHLVLTVNKPDVRRFIAWIESADWNPCIGSLFLVQIWPIHDTCYSKDCIKWFYAYDKSIYRQCNVVLLKCIVQNVNNQTLTQVSQMYVHVFFCLKVMIKSDHWWSWSCDVHGSYWYIQLPLLICRWSSKHY